MTREQAHSEERSLLSKREETTHKQGECNIRTERRVKSAFFRTLGSQQQQRQNLVTCTFEPSLQMMVMMVQLRLKVANHGWPRGWATESVNTLKRVSATSTLDGVHAEYTCTAITTCGALEVHVMENELPAHDLHMKSHLGAV